MRRFAWLLLLACAEPPNIAECGGKQLLKGTYPPPRDGCVRARLPISYLPQGP